MVKYKVIKDSGLDFIEIETPFLKTTLCNLGASIYSIIFDGKYMTLTPKNVDDFKLINIYHGKTIGRVSNRIKGNCVTIEGKKYYIENNEGENTLHGGYDGISTKTFNYHIFEKENEFDVVFDYISPNLESGFPGNLTLKVTYSISLLEAKIRIYFEATTDKDTMCSLTNHAYFCLGSKSIRKMSLQIPSSYYVDVNPLDLIAVEKKEVPSYLDFRTPKPIMLDIENEVLKNSRTNGYDHYFYFDVINPSTPSITIFNTKYQMDIKTDFGGTQIYSDNWPDDFEFFTPRDPNYRGLAIEPSETHLEEHILHKGEKYSHFISYCFKKK